MTMEFPLSQSPRTQGFQMPQAPEDEKDLFTQGFSDLAYRAFQKTQPELVSNVLTFRVLDVDAESGTGIGTFILQNEQDIVFVPCVVSENSVKPLDLFYSRSNDRFYPFTSEWLRESSKDNVNQLGSGVRAPKSMPTDVDIRNLVVPPTTGRYSYASDMEDVAWLPFLVAVRKEKTAEFAGEPRFLDLIGATSNGFKTAFAKVLHRRPKIAKLFAEFYGAEKVANAISRREKTAQEHRKEVPMTKSVAIMTNATPVAQIKRELKPGEAALAFKQIRLHGFYVKDPRPATDSIYSFAESDLCLQQPTVPGVYKVYLTAGGAEPAIIIPKPVSVHRRRSDEARFPYGYYHDDRNRDSGLKLRRGFLVLFQDGRYAIMDDMVAEPITNVAHKEVQDFLETMTKPAPANGEYGVLISADDMDIRALEPMAAENVVSTKNRTTFNGAYHHTIIMNKSMSGNGIVYPQDSDTLMVAGSFRWFKCGKQLANSEILATPGAVFRLVEYGLLKQGAQKILVKKAGLNFVVNADGAALPSLKAVEKVANVYNVSVKEASEIVTLIGAGLPISAWRVKTAQGESLDPNAPPVDPNAQQAAPPPPPPPSGLDLATQEKLQQIQSQIAALQQMQQILTEVQQRAQMIDQGGGAMAAPGAAAAMAAGPGMMGGQPAMAPPDMGGQMPQGQPGMEQGQPGMEQGQPPPPVMPEGPVSEQNLEQQMNPNFLQDAASLQDARIFDAAAIASMVKQKGMRDILQNYLPSVEKAMDNLGRMLLLFYMKEGEIKQQVGAEVFEETENKIRDVFRGMGDALLALKQYSEPRLPAMAR